MKVLTFHLKISAVRVFFLVVFFCISNTYSSHFFLEETYFEKKAESKSFSYGLGTGFSFLFSQLDWSLYASSQYQFHPSFSAGLYFSTDPLESRFEFGSRLHYYFKPEDFFMSSVSGLLFENHAGWKFPPRVALGYGKNFTPWPEAQFYWRGVIYVSYLFFEHLESSKNSFGVSETNQVVLHCEFSILFF